MRKKRPTEDAALNTASGLEVLASVAVVAKLLIDCIRDTDPNESYKPSQKLAAELETQLEVLSEFAQQYQVLFKMIAVELPPWFKAIRVDNPYFEEGTEAPSDKSNGAARDWGDDYPF